MNASDFDKPDIDRDISQRAVSIYGQNEGMDDFPVLKAFQQYIDAEQEKARKRIFGLGIFFCAVLIIVIAVFMVVVYGINARNQSLSDRLVEYAMRESDRHQNSQQAQQATMQNDATIKAMTDAIVSLQKKIDSVPEHPAAVSGHNKPSQEDSEQLNRTKALLDAERQRLAIEKERLHNKEIELQRRKLYPELYASDYQDDEKFIMRKSNGNANAHSHARMLSDEDIREIIREAYPESEPQKTEKAAPDKKDAIDARAQDDETDEAIEYYKDDDYSIPVDIKGSSSKVRFTVPVE